MDMAITLSHNEQDVQVDELSRKLLWLRHLAEIFTLDIMFIVRRARGAGHSSPWPQGGGDGPIDGGAKNATDPLAQIFLVKAP